MLSIYQRLEEININADPLLEGFNTRLHSLLIDWLH